mmetsp:Transcript_52991/g.87989  ORF Transcript_52991/g.87989 Transcript_52991/m.87989 type:complete len:221 (-) Transcript_52991:789-1451(-)
MDCWGLRSTEGGLTTYKTSGCCIPTSSNTSRLPCCHPTPAAPCGSGLAFLFLSPIATLTTCNSSQRSPLRTSRPFSACQPILIEPCRRAPPRTCSQTCGLSAQIHRQVQRSIARSGLGSCRRSSVYGRSCRQAASRCKVAACLWQPQARPLLKLLSPSRWRRPSCFLKQSTTLSVPSGGSCAALNCLALRRKRKEMLLSKGLCHLPGRLCGRARCSLCRG